MAGNIWEPYPGISSDSWSPLLWNFRPKEKILSIKAVNHGSSSGVDSIFHASRPVQQIHCWEVLRFFLEISYLIRDFMRTCKNETIIFNYKRVQSRFWKLSCKTRPYIAQWEDYACACTMILWEAGDHGNMTAMPMRSLHCVCVCLPALKHPSTDADRFAHDSAHISVVT